MRQFRNITLRNLESRLHLVIRHGLDKAVQFLTGVAEHRTATGGEHRSGNRLATLRDHTVPMRAQFSNGLHVSSSAHEIIDVAVVLVDVFKDIDASAVRIYRELELDLVAGVVHDTLSKLLGVFLEGAGLVFHDRNSILYSIEDGTPALIAQIDVGLVCEGVQEPTRQVRDIDGDGAGEQVEGRMTSTVPDGIQLCGSDNAVAELDNSASGRNHRSLHEFE